jgi:hypothetical protein
MEDSEGLRREDPYRRQWNPIRRADPASFIERHLIEPQTGEPFVLLPAERAFLQHAFTLNEDGRLRYNEWLYSCPKKSGKTTFAAIITLTMIFLFGGHYPEVTLAANDQEQAVGRVFEMCRRIIRTGSSSPPSTPPSLPSPAMPARPPPQNQIVVEILQCAAHLAHPPPR